MDTDLVLIWMQELLLCQEDIKSEFSSSFAAFSKQIRHLCLDVWTRNKQFLL